MVNLTDIEEYVFAVSGARMQHQYYLDVKTGVLYSAFLVFANSGEVLVNAFCSRLSDGGIMQSAGPLPSFDDDNPKGVVFSNDKKPGADLGLNIHKHGDIEKALFAALKTRSLYSGERPRKLSLQFS